MPRADFVNDLARATSYQIDHITCIVPEDDGQFSFYFQSIQNHTPIRIDVCLEDVSLYPRKHRYLVFAGHDAPSSLTAKLEAVTSRLDRLSVSELLSCLSDVLVSGKNDWSSKRDDLAGSKDSYDFDADDEMFDLEDPHLRYSHEGKDSYNAQIRRDFSFVKAAGFKIGYHGCLAPGGSCFVSVSCRIVKLGISEEAMKAWFVQPNNYLILLLYYPEGYKSLERVLASSRPQNEVEFCVGIGDSYKPKTKNDAHAAFHMQDPTPGDASGQGQQAGQRYSSFRPCLLSKSLTALLTERFIQLLKCRLYQRLSWAGAELYYEDYKDERVTTSINIDEKYEITDPVPPTFPRLARADDLHLDEPVTKLSFPLVAMQFVVRHFVRCIDFCLVCHRRLTGQTEAIRPYVCDRQLCLFQYMSLGLGPAIEHEILQQPYVVDLLVSFCYASAASSCLKDLPKGLGLIVPREADGKNQDSGVFSGIVKKDMSAISVDVNLNQPPLRAGQWIMIKHPKRLNCVWHCCIEDDSAMPILRVSEIRMVPLGDPSASAARTRQDSKGLSGQKVFIHLFDTNFDSLGRAAMMQSICFLLDTLPTISEMVQWLQRQPGRLLRDWKDVVSPAALGILRWIMASNRSCIMQVGSVGLTEDEAIEQISQDHVAGNPGWMQFKFATGAPDKEQRFVQELRTVTDELSLRYPSRFAWHGSSVHNWHGIIREGLNYDKVVNGRAQGDGVYLSPYFGTSLGYTVGRNAPNNASTEWHSSMLRITAAVALTEVVNAPSRYTSSNPHFVLKQLDWIQTRYLFVKTSGLLVGQESHKLNMHIQQDPDRHPCGPSGQPITLPVSAIPSTRRQMMYQTQQANSDTHASKKSRRGKKRKRELIDLTTADDKTDTESVKTLAEDLEPLVDPLAVSEATKLAQEAERKKRLPFDPSSLGAAKVPVLHAPTYGNRTATMKLQKVLQAMVTLQTRHKEANTLYELGWYVDEEHVERTGHLYQWLVALHSFELSLPLAQDMQQHKIDSVLLEIRFHDSYPHSPPFVRVIRPRFLPFSHGGGGHITGGGSVCMDLLTNTGWSAVYDMEAVLLEVRLALQNVEPQPARLAVTSRTRSSATPSDYSMSEAVDAYERVCRAHGWAVPPTLRAIANAK